MDQDDSREKDETGEGKLPSGEPRREAKPYFAPHGVIRPRELPDESWREEFDGSPGKTRKQFKASQKIPFDAVRPPHESTSDSGDRPPLKPTAVPHKHRDEPARPPHEIVTSWWLWIFQWKVPVLPVVIIVAIALYWLANQSSEDGIAEGRRLAGSEAIHEPVAMLPALSLQLDYAMAELRAGRSDAALRSLEQIEQSTTAYPSLTYLVGVAALRSGDTALAEKKSTESILKKERVSDALIIQAIIESRKGAPDSFARAESFLRKSIAIDPANPNPHFELARLLRQQSKSSQALAEVRVAQDLLSPMDSHLLMEITASLIAMEEAPVESFSRDIPQSDDARKLFPAAFAAMRLGDFDRAATLLGSCQKVMSPDLFTYLVNDPALKKYASKPPLKPFFQN